MARFRFRLQPLLDVAERERAAALNECRTIAGRVAACLSALKAVPAQVPLSMIAGHSFGVWALAESDRANDARRARVIALAAAVDRERSQLTVAGERLQLATARRDGLQRLRDRRCEAARRRAEARDEEALEDDRRFRGAYSLGSEGWPP